MTKLERCKAFALAVLIVAGVQTLGQNSTIVRSIRARTADGVEFSISLRGGTASLGNDLVVYYEVINQGSKAIYLVKEPSPKIAVIDNNNTILIQAPYPDWAKQRTFDYSFIIVKPGKIHRGRLIIPKATVERAGPWPIRVAFGYVRNISVFGPRGEPGADADLGELLKERIQIVSLGELVVEYSR